MARRFPGPLSTSVLTAARSSQRCNLQSRPLLKTVTIARPLPKTVSIAREPEENCPNQDGGLDGIVDAIASVSRERHALMEQLREALQNHADTRALALARNLVGLGGQDEKGD
jgi:hypothetical protein